MELTPTDATSHVVDGMRDHAWISDRIKHLVSHVVPVFQPGHPTTVAINGRDWAPEIEPNTIATILGFNGGPVWHVICTDYTQMNFALTDDGGNLYPFPMTTETCTELASTSDSLDLEAFSQLILFNVHMQVRTVCVWC